ncbi:MAG: hypothetical protein QXL94_00515 [Candidatus Parvarchaeum sp.]
MAAGPTSVPPIVVQITASIAPLLAKLKEAQTAIKTFADQEFPTPQLDLDISKFTEKLLIAEEMLEEFKKNADEVSLHLNIDQPLAAITGLQTFMAKHPLRGNVSISTAAAMAKLRLLSNKALAVNELLTPKEEAASAAAASEVEAEVAAAAAAADAKPPSKLATLANSLFGFLGAKAAQGNKLSLLSVLGGGQNRGGLLGMMGLGNLPAFGSLGSLIGLGPEHVIGTALGVGGSAIGAMAGGALLAGGVGSTMAVGMGTDMAGLGQAAGDIKSVYQALTQVQNAQQAYNYALKQYGPTSAAATSALASLQSAQENYNNVLSNVPAVARKAVVAAAQTATQFHALFDKLTGAAESVGAGIINTFMKTGEAFLPTIGKYALTNMKIIAQGMKPGIAWAKSTQTGNFSLPGQKGQTNIGIGGLGIFQNLESIFTKHLPEAIKLATRLLRLFTFAMDVAAQYGGKLLAILNNFIGKTFFGPNQHKELQKVATVIGHLIELFFAWMNLIKAVIHTIYDLVAPSVGLGKDIVEAVTNIINQIGLWARKNRELLHSFYSAHAAEVVKGFGSILEGVVKIALAGLKIFMRFSVPLTKGFAVLLEIGGKVLNFLGNNKWTKGIISVIVATILATKVLQGMMGVGLKVLGLFSTEEGNEGFFVRGIKSVLKFKATLGSVLSTTMGKINGWISGVRAKGGLLGKLFDRIASRYQKMSAVISSAFQKMKAPFTKLWSSIKSSSQAAWENVKGGLQAALNSVKNGISRLQSSLADMWGRMRSAATSALTPIKNMTLKVFTSIRGGLNNLRNAFQSGMNSISNIMRSAWSKMSSMASSAWNGIKNGLSSAWSGLKGLVSKLWGGAAAAEGEEVGVMKAESEAGTSGIKNGLASAWGGLKGLVSKLWGGAADAEGEEMGVMEAESEEGATAINAALDSIALFAIIAILVEVALHWRMIWNAIKDTAIAIWHAIVRFAKFIWHELVTHLKEIMTIIIAVFFPWIAIAIFLYKHWREIVDFAKKIFSPIASFFKKVFDDVWHAIYSAWDDIAKAVKAGVEKVWQLLLELWHIVLRIGGELVHALENAGRNMIHGLINGVKDVWHDAVNFMHHIASGILGIFHDVWGWLSPWKTMRQAGHDMVAGLKIGMEHTSPATTAAKHVGNAVLTSLDFLEKKAEKIGMLVDQDLAKGLEKGTSIILSILNKVRKLFLQEFVTVEKSTERDGTQVTRSLTLGIQAGFKTIEHMLVQVRNLFLQTFLVMEKDANKQGSLVMERLITGIKSSMATVGKFLQLVGTYFADTLMKAFTDGIIKAIPLLGNAIFRVVLALDKLFASNVANMTTQGELLMKALATGITNTTPTVVAAANQTATAAAQAVNKTFAATVNINNAINVHGGTNASHLAQQVGSQVSNQSAASLSAVLHGVGLTF